MQVSYIKLGLLLLLVKLIQCEVESQLESRDEKLISTFQIVRFPNDACVGSNSRNGTCYTSAECSDKSGTSSGSCADGFGVCCTFLIATCGSSTSENITYWTQPSAGITSGIQTDCMLSVCPVTDDICRIRLDFTTFVITGPNTQTTFQNLRRFGQGAYADLTDTAGVRGGVSWATNCMYDVFTASGPSASSNAPEVCGTLTGSHMYLEADTDACNMLTFSFHDYAQTSSTGPPTNTRGLIALASRSWDITITQIECTSATVPPVGCTQYFWGSGGKYIIENYNYRQNTAVSSNQGIHLANQHQRICMRRERGNCIGCYATNNLGFAISGPNGEEYNFVQPAGCCGYMDVPSGGHLSTGETNLLDQGLGNDAASTPQTLVGFDCIIIPGAYMTMNDENYGTPVTTQVASVISATISQFSETYFVTPTGPQICGSEAGIGMGGSSLSNLIEGTGTIAQDDLVAGNGGASLTVCTKTEPFMLEFLSDDMEGQGGDALEVNNELLTGHPTNLGFSITHTQLEC